MSIESKSFENLAKKLSAVRATLDDNERAILDRMVETADLDNVEAHALRITPAVPVDRPMTDVDAHALRITPDVSVDRPMTDVEAHQVIRAEESNAKTFRLTYAKIVQKDEMDVVAHVGFRP